VTRKRSMFDTFPSLSPYRRPLAMIVQKDFERRHDPVWVLMSAFG